MNDELLKNQIILNALRSAKEQIREIYTDQETGKIDDTFGGNEKLYELYYQIVDMCCELSNDTRSWYNK